MKTLLPTTHRNGLAFAMGLLVSLGCISSPTGPSSRSIVTLTNPDGQTIYVSCPPPDVMRSSATADLRAHMPAVTDTLTGSFTTEEKYVRIRKEVDDLQMIEVLHYFVGLDFASGAISQEVFEEFTRGILSRLQSPPAADYSAQLADAGLDEMFSRIDALQTEYEKWKARSDATRDLEGRLLVRDLQTDGRTLQDFPEIGYSRPTKAVARQNYLMMVQSMSAYIMADLAGAGSEDAAALSLAEKTRELSASSLVLIEAIRTAAREGDPIAIASRDRLHNLERIARWHAIRSEAIMAYLLHQDAMHEARIECLSDQMIAAMEWGVFTPRDRPEDDIFLSWALQHGNLTASAVGSERSESFQGSL